MQHTVLSLAAALGVSPAAVREWIDRGSLPVKHRGGKHAADVLEEHAPLIGALILEAKKQFGPKTTIAHVIARHAEPHLRGALGMYPEQPVDVVVTYSNYGATVTIRIPAEVIEKIRRPKQEIPA